MQLLNLKTILTKSNFTKKEGVAVHMVVLHFVFSSYLLFLATTETKLISHETKNY